MKKIVKIAVCSLSLLTGVLLSMQAPGGPRKHCFAKGTSLFNIRFEQAGVLPFTYFMKEDPKNPKKKIPTKYALLSRESRGRNTGTYDAFSGSRERGQNHPVQTAAMELWEEGILENTLGWSKQKTKQYIDLQNGKTENIFVSRIIRTRRCGHGVLYITKFSTKDINKWRSGFYPALQTKKRAGQHKFTEKDRIAVVSWSDLKNVNKYWNVKIEVIEL